MPQVQAGQRVTADLLSEDYALADTNLHTVTQASATGLSTSYPTDGGEQAGAAYRLTAFGSGTWASSGPQQLNIYSYVAGVQINTCGVPAALFATSQAFNWRAAFTLIIATPGTSGTYNTLLDVAIIANSASAGDQGQPYVRTGTAQAINTTLANSMQILAQWGSVTGTPTVTCDGTLFEKLAG